MTFSIIARCARTGQFAAAVASSSPAVAARCAYARAGAGAATTQNITDPRLGPLALELLGSGLTAQQACETLQEQATHLEYRQLTLIDDAGNTACFSGTRTLGIHAMENAINVCAAGNLLANTAVPAAILTAFQESSENVTLGTRVINAMHAGLAAGGEAGPIKSCGLILVDRQAWPIADLRVDWHDAPLDELSRLWTLWEPQMQDYVARALNPASAPAYGVPGDE